MIFAIITSYLVTLINSFHRFTCSHPGPFLRCISSSLSITLREIMYPKSAQVAPLNKILFQGLPAFTRHKKLIFFRLIPLSLKDFWALHFLPQGSGRFRLLLSDCISVHPFVIYFVPATLFPWQSLKHLCQTLAKITPWLLDVKVALCLMLLFYDNHMTHSQSFSSL